MKITILVLLSIAAAVACFAGCSSDEPIKTEYPKFELGTDGGGCNEDGSCDGSLFCIENKCQKVEIETTETDEVVGSAGTCKANQDCEKGMTCHEGKCVVMLVAPECKADQDCPADNTCVAGACQPKESAPVQPPAGGEIVAGECKTNADCKEAGTSCLNGKCEKKPPAVSIKCVTAGDCYKPYGEGAKCIEGACVSSAPYGGREGAPAGGRPPVSVVIAIDAKAQPMIKGSVYKTPPQAIYPFSTATDPNKTINFPDKNLEKAIKEILGIPLYKQVTVGDCAELKSLELNYAGVVLLNGIESCGNLQKFISTGNSLKSLEPLQGLDLGLLRLNVHGIGPNTIESRKSIGNLTGLKDLSLVGVNDLGTLDELKTLKSLMILDLNSDGISNLSPFDKMPTEWNDTLQYLALADNKISDIGPLQRFKTLTQLNLNVNNITDITPLVNNAGIGAGDKIHLRNNPLSSQALKDIEKLEERGVNVFHDKPKVSETAPPPEKIESVELRIKVASSADKGGTDLPVYVSFCKDRQNCIFEDPKYGKYMVNGALANEKISTEGLSEGDVRIVRFNGSDSFWKLPDGFSKEDLNVIRFCIGKDSEGNNDNQLYIGAVMVLVDGKPWYFNPTFFRMLDKGSCTNAIRDEDVFIGLYARTDDDCFYNDGTDDPVWLIFDLNKDKITSSQREDIKNDFQGAGEMNTKGLDSWDKRELLVFELDSDTDDFNCDAKGFYATSAPLASAIELGSFELSMSVGACDSTTDDWDYEPIELYAGKVSDILKDYDTACYYRKHDGKRDCDSVTLTTTKGSCKDLKDLGGKDYSGEMGKGDLAPPEWFDELIKFQKSGGS